jgi:acetyl esterase
MKFSARLKAKALRFFFNRIVLRKVGYEVDAPLEFRDEERMLPTAEGSVRALFHWPAKHEGLLPVFVNIHGGGFLFGLPEHDAVFCRRVAANLQCLVVNLDYAKSPEHPFPKALHQCYGAVSWLAENAASIGIDGARIAVGGHSAGGNLTAGVAAMAKTKGFPKFCLQILDFPFLDGLTDPAQKYARIAKPLLTPGLMSFFNACYLPNAEQFSLPQVSPLLTAVADLAGQAPALVITAEYDVLRDEGDQYADKLKQAGISVRHEVFPGTDHDFIHIGPKESADAAWRLMEECLRQSFSVESANEVATR